jgi:hypothetical protein
MDCGSKDNDRTEKDDFIDHFVYRSNVFYWNGVDKG